MNKLTRSTIENFQELITPQILWWTKQLILGFDHILSSPIFLQISESSTPLAAPDFFYSKLMMFSLTIGRKLLAALPLKTPNALSKIIFSVQTQTRKLFWQPESILFKKYPLTMLELSALILLQVTHSAFGHFTTRCNLASRRY